MRKTVFMVLMLFLFFPILTMAQGVTTGAFSGSVVDVDGRFLVGAEITILHVPTGTNYVTLTRSDGRYNVPAVRVGGPYTITVSHENFKTEKKEDLIVKLGETKTVNFTLQLATVDAGEVVVTATDHVINPNRTGASQNVVQEAIESLPTITRSLSDFTRMAPQMVADDENAGAFWGGGRNSKYNNVQIDGAQTNDLFGLGSSGTPGGQSDANIISLDAVQEFQIVLAPYDVRQGGFTGGGVNIITKSGTNEFHGTAFFEGRNQDFVGRGPSDYEFATFTAGVYGFTAGGPIIKNKLFFFANAEYSKMKEPEDYYIDGSGAEHDFGHKDEADRFASILSGYGYDAGGYGEITNDRERLNLFARLDWNISDRHQLTLRHSFLDSTYDQLSRSSRSFFTFYNGGYFYATKSNSLVLQLQSTFSNILHNELMINYQTIRDNPSYNGEPFPNIQVRTDTGVTFQAGSEEYRHANELNQDLIEITDNLTIFKGKHTITIGTHNEFFKFYNVYIQRAFGKYEFSSLDDFEAGNVYRFDRYYSLTGDPNAPAEFKVFQLGFYIGDEFNVTNDLKLTLGIRADIPVMPDDPSNNPDVMEDFNIPTNHNAGGNILWSPRFGFNFAASEKLQFRGGIGIFSGRAPYVWISNQYSNTGVDLGRYRVYYPDFFVTDPFGQPESATGEPAPGDINLIDDGFKFPQVLKTNIAVDYRLPWGFTLTGEFVYTKNVNEVLFQNINVAPTGETNAFDGRPLFGSQSTSGSARYGYPDYVSDRFQNVILLSNTNEGYTYNISFQLQKEWGRGNMINTFYSFGKSMTQFSGTSSRAISNWGYNITAGDPNNPDLAPSSHDPGHRVGLAVTKRFDFFEKAPTTISIFYNGRSGRRYSTRYYNDINGDSRTNDSIWVPASEDQIILTRGSWDDLDQYIRDDPALDSHRGQILPRNASRDPWYSTVDLKLTQEIPVPGLKGHRLEVFLTVKNLFNWFNQNLGVYRYISYDEYPLTFVGYDEATGKPKFEFWGDADTPDERFNINQLLSRWQMLIGVKYRF
jgi:hypothetical protein